MIRLELKIRGDIEPACLPLTRIVEQYSQAGMRINTQNKRSGDFYASVIFEVDDDSITDVLISIVGLIEAYGPDTCSISIERSSVNSWRGGLARPSPIAAH